MSGDKPVNAVIIMDGSEPTEVVLFMNREKAQAYSDGLALKKNWYSWILPTKPPEDRLTMTCVYCGHEYPDNTPASGAKILKEHIRICPKHPLREAEENIGKLRKALIKIVGSEDVKELMGMQSCVERNHCLPEDERQSLLVGIQALIDTAPKVDVLSAVMKPD